MSCLNLLVADVNVLHASAQAFLAENAALNLGFSISVSASFS
jgi:hypothetical protein